MALIYRVEDLNGVGLYRCGCGLRCAEIMQYKRHPTPSEDAELSAWWSRNYKTRAEYIFGYSTLEQLKSWIYAKKWRVEIKQSGLVCSVYETNDFIVGATQAVFRNRTAKKIGEIDILDLDAPMTVV